MNIKDNQNEIAKYEKAISKKYGPTTIQNPKKDWNKEKEEKYLEDLKKFYKQKENSKTVEKREGFDILEKKKTKSSTPKTCPVCSAFSISSRDDLYMNKFSCCFDCYIQYVEGREERWKTGWRPNK